MPPLPDLLDDFQFLEGDDRISFLIDLGRQLPPMPPALKTDATLVRGCSASVWVYPTVEDDRMHFAADSNAAITKGLVALVVAAVDGLPAERVAGMDIAAEIAPFELGRHLSSNRTQGIPNMIALIKETAGRISEPKAAA